MKCCILIFTVSYLVKSLLIFIMKNPWHDQCLPRRKIILGSNLTYPRLYLAPKVKSRTSGLTFICFFSEKAQKCTIPSDMIFEVESNMPYKEKPSNVARYFLQLFFLFSYEPCIPVFCNFTFVNSTLYRVTQKDVYPWKFQLWLWLKSYLVQITTTHYSVYGRPFTRVSTISVDF